MSEQDPPLVSVEKVEPTANTTVESQQQENTTVPSETTPSTSTSHEITTTTNTVDSLSENSTEPTENSAINGTSGDANNHESPQASNSNHNKEKKRKTRDEQLIAMSPELTGKRQRKVSSLLSDFEVDKKTIEKTLEVPSSENQATGETAAPPRIVATIRIKPPSGSSGKKEVVMTQTEAQEKAKKLPKGYAFEVVAENSASGEAQIVEGKRERKKSGADSPEDPSKKKVKKESKQSGLSIVEVANENKVAADVTKLNAIENNLAAISHTLEKTLNETPSSPIQLTSNLPAFLSPEMPDVEPESLAVPSYASTPAYDSFEPKKKKGRKKKTQDASYEKFESDDDDEEFELDYEDDEERPKKKLKVRITGSIGVTLKQHTPGKRGPIPKALKIKTPSRVEVEEEPVFDPAKANVLLQLHKILLELKRHKSSIFFLNPGTARKYLQLNLQVDPERDGAPDYYNVIKKPMDFHTMEEKISDGDYNNPEEFCADMRLIFQNATTYNPPASKVFTDALTLWRLFEKQVTPHGLAKNIPKNLVPPKPKPKSIREAPIPPLPPLPPPAQMEQIDIEVKKQMEAAIQELRESVKQVNGEIKRIKQQKFGIAQSPKPPRPPKQTTTTPKQQPTAPPKKDGPRAPRGRPKAVTQPKEEKEMSFSEKQALSENISTLNAEHLGNIVKIIQSKNPGLTQQTAELYEIDLEELDTSTLRALERYVLVAQGKIPRPEASTDSTIRGVQKKLKEIESRTGSRSRRHRVDDEEDIEIGDERHNAAYPSVVIEKDKRGAHASESSESSSSSSSSSESDTSSSPSEVEKKKKHEKPQPMQIDTPAPVPVISAPAPAVDKPVSEKKDRPAPRSPLREDKSEPLKPPQAADAMDDSLDPLPILPTSHVKKEIELKNLDSWANLTSDVATPTPEVSQSSKPKDEAWAKFQTKDMLNKQREKELQEQEERERQQKAEREAERRRLHEQQLKDAQEAEERRKREEEENQLAYQRELLAKREKEKRERESSSASINMLDQFQMMSSFEQEARAFQAERPAILQMFKLKEENSDDKAEDKEDGEIGTR